MITESAARRRIRNTRREELDQALEQARLYNTYFYNYYLQQCEGIDLTINEHYECIEMSLRSYMEYRLQCNRATLPLRRYGLFPISSQQLDEGNVLPNRTIPRGPFPSASATGIQMWLNPNEQRNGLALEFIHADKTNSNSQPPEL